MPPDPRAGAESACLGRAIRARWYLKWRLSLDTEWVLNREAGKGVTRREAFRPERLKEASRGEPAASVRTAGRTVGS